jgi:hypothetical protein
MAMREFVWNDSRIEFVLVNAVFIHIGKCSETGFSRSHHFFITPNWLKRRYATLSATVNQALESHFKKACSAQGIIRSLPVRPPGFVSQAPLARRQTSDSLYVEPFHDLHEHAILREHVQSTL